MSIDVETGNGDSVIILLIFLEVHLVGEVETRVGQHKEMLVPLVRVDRVLQVEDAGLATLADVVLTDIADLQRLLLTQFPLAGVTCVTPLQFLMLHNQSADEDQTAG